MKRFLIILISSMCFVARADIGSFPRTFVVVGQNIHTGDDNESFAEGGNGTKISLLVITQKKILVPFFSTSLNFMQSSQTFLDRTTEVTSRFNYYSAEANLGARFYPLVREKEGFNPFISGGALIGYNIIQLNKNTSLTSIPHSDQSFSGGYTAGMGAEWIVDKVGNYRTTLLFQAQYHASTATLLDRTFNLNHFSFGIGIGW